MIESHIESHLVTISIPVIVIIVIVLTIYFYLLISNKLKQLEKQIAFIRKYLRISEKTIPSRIRKRYIVFYIMGNKPLDKKKINNAIRSAWKNYLGELSLIKADPQVIVFDQKLARGVLRVAHIYKKEAIAILGLIRNIDESEVLLIPLKTTSTLKKARKTMYEERR